MGNLRDGIYTPLVTPFSNGQINYKSLRSNLEKLNRTNVAGYVILGSTSESVLLNRKEKLRIVEQIHSFLECKDKSVIIGVMEESTEGSKSFIMSTEKYNPDAYLILPPTYYKPIIDKKVIKNYFSSIRKFTETPVFYYNIPKFSGISIETDTLLDLAVDEHINGWKDSSADKDRFKEVVNMTDASFHNFNGHANFLLEGLSNGSNGGILALSNLIPNVCTDLYAAHAEGHSDDADKLQSVLIGFYENIITPYELSGLKCAMDMLGYEGGSVRKPYSDISEEESSDVRQFLESGGFL